jgi:tetratricopeptide (TPR) repeat protein
MDLVKGAPITKYCDAHHLTPRQRLELFLPICQAIQHAHQKGIIHRDLKPSNVLVALYDGKPVPKVIDFGVAKAAGQSLTDKTLVTGFGNIVGTLEYMSPEQAEVNQLDIDTRSDIYSLGVLLYELLAGSPPFSRKDLEKAGMLEMLRVIREQEPSRPSTKLSTAEGLPTLAANRGTEPAKLTKLVRGELDWIVMKALEKDRNRRYETANGFALDVQRYLADEPVLACPPSALYRFRKFARRNKVGLAVAGLVLFFLVILGSGVGWTVRDRAARQARVGGQVESIFAEVDRLEREQKWPEALAAARPAEALVAGGEGHAATAERVRDRLKDLEFIDRLERIRMQRAMLVDGQVDNAGADRGYAQAFRDYGVDVDELAVETAIDRLKARPTLAIPVGAALDDWVGTRIAIPKRPADGWKRLVAVARGIDSDLVRDRLRSFGVETVPDVQGELRRLAGSIDLRAQHPATLIRLAVSLRQRKDSHSALRLLREAQLIYPADFWLNFELAHALAAQNDHEGAVRFYSVAVGVKPHCTAALNNLGARLFNQGKIDEAIACYRRAIELDSNLAITHDNLGLVFHLQGQWDEAIAHARRAIDIDPTFGGAHDTLALVLATCPDPKFRDPRRAVEHARRAFELQQSGRSLQVLGWAQYCAGAWRESIEALEESCKLENGGDSGQWIVMSLAHWKLANGDDLPEADKARHRAEARRWYEAAAKRIDGWTGRPSNEIGAAIWDFRQEARKLIGPKVEKK